MEEILSGLSGDIGSIIFTVILLIVGFLLLRILITFLKNWWLDESQKKYAAGIDYVLLEIRFPKNNEIFPKAMEQVFASLYQIYSFGIDPEDKWLKGQFEEKVSAEMVGSKDGIKFFIRINRKNQAIIEAAIFSQYPGAEIVEAQKDYVSELPSDIPNNEYDILGVDMVLKEDNAYPIKTYRYFFGERKYEEEEIDPIAILAEVMSGLRGDERLWMQVLITPTGGELKKAAEKVIAEKMGKKAEEKKGIGSSLVEFAVQAVQAPVKVPEWGDESAKPEDRPKNPTAQDNEIIRAVSEKASKTSFFTTVRLVYIDKKETFSGSNFKAAASAFQQYNTQHLNSMRPAKATKTSSPRFYVPNRKGIVLERKKNMYINYIDRSFSPYTNVQEMFHKHLEPSIMNIEELATIFHPPIGSVKATGLDQPESRKGAPPANLPME